MLDTSGSRDDDSNVSGSGTGELASSQGSVTSVKVAVRVRPLIALERGQGCQAVMFGNSDDDQVLTGDNRCFRFDNVFGVDSTQEEVYSCTTLPLVERCLEGFNATVLAYGQTGSGKTWTVGNAYTVNGAPEDAGIIPRAVIDIFKRVDELRTQGIKASVCASFLEVINEEIRDLVGGGGSESAGGVSGPKDIGGLPLRENLQGEVTVAGLSQHEISGPEDLGSLLERGALCRATARTNMNAHSSRSHAICTLTFEVVRPATSEAEETITSSRFHLVDLAGSERAKRTGAEGQRLREGININKGLLALGNVISALSEGGAASSAAGGGHHVHVPYRDSKLTRLLQSSLGGNAHTVMIACISPADSNMAESINTLRYAGRAMNIKNTAVKNEGASGTPVSFAEVVALRKEVRVLQVELMHARLSGLGKFGFSAGGATPGEEGSCAGGGEGAGRAAVKEAAELRREKEALERRVLEATRHATQAVEGEMSARLESDRWRLRCEQILAVLKEAAPQSFGGLPSWATGIEPDAVDSIVRSSTETDSPACVGDGAASASASAGAAPLGSLERELRQRVFDLEAQVFELEGKLALAGGDRRREGPTRRGGVTAVVTIRRDLEDDDDDQDDEDGNGNEEDDEEAFDEENSEGDAEEIRRVDQEIEDKERELLLKAEQARAYEAMKGQFEGLLGRLQGEVSSLQSERDVLLQKLSSNAPAVAGPSSARGGAGNKADGGAAFARMKARVAELEARIKENRKKVAEHQRAERERAAAAKEVDRLRTEVSEAKYRRAELQRVHREASTRFMKETREHQLKEARMRRDGQRMQWQVKKLQDSHEKTQAALKRKMEEHSMAMRKMRKLQSQKPQGVRGGDVTGGGRAGGDSAMREAKKSELAAWLASEIEEASAVQRVKRALKTQLKLRADAARKAQRLRGEGQAERSRGEGDEDGREGKDATATGELEDLEERIVETSKVIQSLQSFLVSADRNSATTGSRTASGAVGNTLALARWTRLRTPWDNKTALSLLLGEAVKAKVLGLDFAEASSLKDVEIRELSREVASLRSADKAVNRAAAAQAALAEAEAEVMAAVGRVEVKKEDTEAAAEGEGVVENEAVEEGEYEQEERSFIEISDSEDEEEDFEDDDKDEEWLPENAAAARKRSSTQSAAAAPEASSVLLSHAENEPEGQGVTGTDVDEVTGEVLVRDCPRTKRGCGSRTDGHDGGPRSSGDRSSSGSAVSSALSERSERSVLSSNSADAGREEGEEEVDWDNLASHTVIQLKALLRRHFLPVTGRKDVLIGRIRTSLLIDRSSASLPRQSWRSSLSSYSGAAAANSADHADGGKQNQEAKRSGVDAGGIFSVPEIGSGSGNDVEHEGTLRERLKARARARGGELEEVEAENGAAEDTAKMSSSVPKVSTSVGRSNKGKLAGPPPPPPDGDRSTAQPTGSAAIPSLPRASLSEGKAAPSVAASTKAEPPPPPARRPLGVLSQGNMRVGGNSNAISKENEKGMVKSTKPGGTSATGDTGVKKISENIDGGDACVQINTNSNRSDGFGSSDSKLERARSFSALGRSGNNGSSGAHHRPGDVKDGNARRVAKSSVHVARRVKVNGATKPTGGARYMPSFLKPTKSSGAHVSAALKARSSDVSGNSSGN